MKPKQRLRQDAEHAVILAGAGQPLYSFSHAVRILALRLVAKDQSASTETAIAFTRLALCAPEGVRDGFEEIILDPIVAVIDSALTETADTEAADESAAAHARAAAQYLYDSLPTDGRRNIYNAAAAVLTDVAKIEEAFK